MSNPDTRNMATPDESHLVLDWPYQVPSALVQRCVDVAAIERIESSPANWVPYQSAAIGHLLTHVLAHNPWWDEWLGSQTVAQLMANWAQVPVLSRQHLRQSIDATQKPADSPNGFDTVMAVTRGHNGQAPLELFHTWHLQRLNAHQMHADHQRHARSLAGVRAAIGPVAQDHLGDHTWVPGIGDLNESLLMVRNQGRFSANQHLAWLKTHDIFQLTLNTALLAELVAMAEQTAAATRPTVRHILTAGDTLSPALRQRAESALGAKVFDRYVCEEAGPLAFQGQNPDANGNWPLHVATSHVLLEVLGPDNQHVQAGERGRVVVTALHQWHHPVIRYDLGDTAQWHPSCPVSGAQVPTLMGEVLRAG